MEGRAAKFLIEHWKDGVEILIIALLLYASYRYLRRIRGARILFEFLLVLVSLTLVSHLFNLEVVNWLIRTFAMFFLVGLIVIFQPELRRAIVELESFNLFSLGKERQDLVEQMTEICRQLSSKRYGALFAIQRGMDLGDYLETGVKIDSELSSELILTIFHPKTALHDGGMILKGGRIEGAACVFPVSQRELMDRSIGLRHRAAMGITEATDCVAIVVSEETGSLALAFDGELERHLSLEEFTERLRELLESGEDGESGEDEDEKDEETVKSRESHPDPDAPRSSSPATAKLGGAGTSKNAA